MKQEAWERLWEQLDPDPRSPPEPDLEERLDALEEEQDRLHNGLITLRDRIAALERTEQARPLKEEREERRRQGRKGRAVGFVVGVALAWLVTALTSAGLLLGWKATCWTAEVLGIPPALLAGLMLLLLLGSILLKESEAVADWFLDEPEDDDEEEF